MAEEDKFDVAVVGAGPAGMMAAGIAASLGQKVVLIEKNSELGKKLLLTGNGKCNLTNAEFSLRELASHYNNGEFLFRAFSVFGPKETIEFFEELGIETRVERNKKVFPISGNAEEVLSALRKHLSGNKVKIIFNSEVVDIIKKGNKIEKLVAGGKGIIAKKYIFSTGGSSYPLTGSNGAGYRLIEKLGHTIVKPIPALCPISIKQEWEKKLQGISLKDIKITVICNQKKELSRVGEILFTHFGLSGPTVLDISGKVGDLLEGHEVKVRIDFFPLINQEQLFKNFNSVLTKSPSKTIKNVLSTFVPERLAEVLLAVLKINGDRIANSISKIERGAVAKILKNFEIGVKDILGFEQAMVTRGGVSVKEIDHKTMKSKIINNLFFAGEIIDIDGTTGGFNLQECWSTGYLAGKNARS